MIWWIVAAVAAFFIKGLCGFTNGLVFTTILSFTTDNVNISPVSLALGYPPSFIVAYRNRRHISWKFCLPLALLVILGNIPGAFVLKHADTGIIKVILGFVIIYLSLTLFMNEYRPRPKKTSRLSMIITGAVAGLVAGIYGVGALMGVYVKKNTPDTASFKANANVIYFVSDTFRLGLYIAWGIVTWEVVRQALLLVPFMLASLFLGMKCARLLNDRIVRRIVMLMLVISGLALIVNNWP